MPGGFKAPQLPSLYAPFGIQAIGGDIYVTCAKQEGAGSAEEEHGAGLGIVNVFDPQGHLIRRIASHGPLNSPRGIALAPASFGDNGILGQPTNSLFWAAGPNDETDGAYGVINVATRN